MKYDHIVKYNGVLYQAGQEVPNGNETKLKIDVETKVYAPIDEEQPIAKRRGRQRKEV